MNREARVSPMKRLIRLLVSFFLACGVARASFAAEAYPARPVHLVIPNGTGAPPDILAPASIEHRGGTPEDFAAFLKADRETAGRLMKLTKVQPQ